MTQELIYYHKTKMRLAEAEGRTEDYKFHKAAIEMLSQPSLPSNLDEAAEEVMPISYGSLEVDCYGGSEPVYSREQMKKMFKAGAELMAEQGVSMLGRVGIYGVDVESITKELREAGFNLGEEIILQIRKKQ